MEKILLRVTGVRTESRRQFFLQRGGRGFGPSAPVVAFHDPRDPRVDGKSGQPFESEKHHAIGHLAADARKFAQGITQFLVTERAHFFQVSLTGGNALRRGAQVLCAVTEPTGAQFVLRRGSQRRRRRVGTQVRSPHGGSEPRAQRGRHLADMRDLFHGGSDKRCQAFPSRLPDHPQAAAKVQGRKHRCVPRESRINTLQIVVHGEITVNRCSVTLEDHEASVVLAHRGMDVADQPFPRSVGALAPMEHLTAIERRPQVDGTISHGRPRHGVRP